MTPELSITIVTNLVTLVGGGIGIWYALQKGMDAALGAAVSAAAKAAEVEQDNAVLRSKSDDLSLRVARMEVLQERHGKELEQGVARIEAGLTALHARLDRVLSQERDR